MLRGGSSGLGSAVSDVGREGLVVESGVMEGFLMGVGVGAEVGAGVEADVGAGVGADVGTGVGADSGPGTSEARGMSETLGQVRMLVEADNAFESHTPRTFAYAAACASQSQVAVSTTCSFCVVEQNPFFEISFSLIVLNKKRWIFVGVALNDRRLIFIAGVATSNTAGTCVDSQDLTGSSFLV